MLNRHLFSDLVCTGGLTVVQQLTNAHNALNEQEHGENCQHCGHLESHLDRYLRLGES